MHSIMSGGVSFTKVINSADVRLEDIDLGYYGGSVNTGGDDEDGAVNCRDDNGDDGNDSGETVKEYWLDVQWSTNNKDEEL